MPSGYDGRMFTEKQRDDHRQWLLEVTAIPTAAGREQRVIEWVQQWTAGRKNLSLRTDAVGNLVITPRGASSKKASSKKSGPKPIYFTAHLDHPAFVVEAIHDDGAVECTFRGGVNDPYFDEARVDLFDAEDKKHTGRVESLDSDAKPFKRVTIGLSRKRSADALQPGDVGRWAFRGVGAEPTVRDGILHAPACDDLAAVAAALAALDVLHRRKGMAHVGVLLTRAEEVGFMGCIAAAKKRSVPKASRLICLENSRSFAESPIGGGPIVRVGDRMSVFAPGLTNRISNLMLEHAKKNESFKWQRKLMPGGACEATVRLRIDVPLPAAGQLSQHARHRRGGGWQAPRARRAGVHLDR